MQESLKESESRGDLRYIRKINELMTEASARARKRVRKLGLFFETRPAARPGSDRDTYRHCFFSQFFHEEMKALATKAGLRRC